MYYLKPHSKWGFLFVGGWVDLGMIRYISLLLLIGLAWGQKDYNINQLIEQGGIYMEKFSDEIVNGNVYQMSDDIIIPLGKMKNGKKDGLWTKWYPQEHTLSK